MRTGCVHVGRGDSCRVWTHVVTNVSELDLTVQ